MGLLVKLNLRGKICLVVGIGKVGQRKIKQFQHEGANVIALGRSLPENRLDGVRYEQGVYSRECLSTLRPWLVVAATDDLTVNGQIVADCAEEGILTMDVSDPARADIKGLMGHEVDGIEFAVSTGVPLLSRMLVGQIKGLITPGVATFAQWQRALRDPAKDLIPHQPDRADLWEEVHESDVLALLEEGKTEAARARLGAIVGPELAQFLVGL